LSLAVPETGKALDAMTVNPEKFDDWYQHLPKKDISLLSPEGHQKDEVQRKAVAPASSPAVTAANATRGNKISKPITIKKTKEKNSLAPQSEATVIKQPPRATPEKPKSAPPYLQDLPPQVQEEIPKLLFAGHAYAVDPAQRMIIINGKIMREGDRLDAMTKLAEITWEGVIIDRKGVRFQVKAH
jgi:general secretion pathway protein B